MHEHPILFLASTLYPFLNIGSCLCHFQKKNGIWKTVISFIITILISPASCDIFELICPEQVPAALGSNTTINCTVSGDHHDLDQVCWSREGRPIAGYQSKCMIHGILLDENHVRQGDVSLIIPFVQESDSGNYTCFVFKKETYRTRNITLSVEAQNEMKKQEHSKPTPNNNGTVTTGPNRELPSNYLRCIICIIHIYCITGLESFDEELKKWMSILKGSQKLKGINSNGGFFYLKDYCSFTSSTLVFTLSFRCAKSWKSSSELMFCFC
ncbi:uncharacterized protein LOC120531913 [Polypterus senegalus]|uniref:uncharacterized protein LOC120531913 n=1 Tax=Polypterus senegalus TaxID=55291 RepID=UPI001962B70E|nr:uncharacterized protein LOC120531913 [Polypterus senegalus]XP_039613703.1 uncharacterized protein LOC120531913 [Polypterus senegalus]